MGTNIFAVHQRNRTGAERGIDSEQTH
jgi:hypothetical protein